MLNDNDLTISPNIGAGVVLGYTEADQLCLVADESPQRLQLQGYWIKHENVALKTQNETSMNTAVNTNGRFQLAQMRSQVEMQGYSTITYTRGCDDSVMMHKLTTQDVRNCMVDCDNSVTHQFVRHNAFN